MEIISSAVELLNIATDDTGGSEIIKACNEV
jgi:hypothetical protein